MRMDNLASPVAIASTLVLMSTLVPFGVSCGGEEVSSDKIGVVVTILPQAEFVGSVGGEKVRVTVMIPSGASPHTYEPTPGQMKDLARADMYAMVGSGLGFELAWIDRITDQNEEMLVVDCSEGVELLEMADRDGVQGEEHGHGAKDPHIWMSPVNAKRMVENICDGLVLVDPESRAYYEQNRDTYLQELTELHQHIGDGLGGVVSRVFMVYHPSFGYFASEYGLTMIPIEEEGKEPTAADIADLIGQARQHDIKVIFASPQFNPQSAEVIADELGARVVFVDPLAGDYIANLRLFVGELVEAMG